MNKRIIYGAIAVILKLLMYIATENKPDPETLVKGENLFDECEAIANGRQNV